MRANKELSEYITFLFYALALLTIKFFYTFTFLGCLSPGFSSTS